MTFHLHVIFNFRVTMGTLAICLLLLPICLGNPIKGSKKQQFYLSHETFLTKVSVIVMSAGKQTNSVIKFKTLPTCHHTLLATVKFFRVVLIEYHFLTK